MAPAIVGDEEKLIRRAREPRRMLHCRVREQHVTFPFGDVDERPKSAAKRSDHHPSCASRESAHAFAGRTAVKHLHLLAGLEDNHMRLAGVYANRRTSAIAAPSSPLAASRVSASVWRTARGRAPGVCRISLGRV